MRLLPPSLCQCSVSRIFKAIATRVRGKWKQTLKSPRIELGTLLLRKARTSQLSYACKCWFLRRGENRSTQGKTSRSRVENQETQPTYRVESGNRSWATLVEGECSHHCASPAPAPAPAPDLPHESPLLKQLSRNSM